MSDDEKASMATSFRSEFDSLRAEFGLAPRG
jgi:hypothetical protein